MNRMVHIYLIFLLAGCTANDSSISETEMAIGMAGLENVLTDQFEPKQLNFKFEYEQVDLNKHQKNKLLYLYDWNTGVTLTYGKARANTNYMSLALGHKRIKSLEALLKNSSHNIKGIYYDPTLSADAVIVTEFVNNPSKSVAVK